VEGRNFRALYDEAAKAFAKREWQHAEKLLREVIAQRPRHPEALHLLGIICVQTGRLDEGIGYLRQAVSLKTYFVEALGNLGAALVVRGQDPREAEDILRRAITLRPDHAISVSNLGRALHQQSKLDEAIAFYRQALKLRPDFAETHLRLAEALTQSGDLDAAITAGQTAVALAPHLIDAKSGLGIILNRVGRTKEAAALFRAVIAAEPRHIEAASNLVAAGNYDPDVGAAQSAEEHFAWGRRHGILASPEPTFTNPTDPEKRLRVGYLSADFCLHSVAFFLEPLLAHHGLNSIDAGVEPACYVLNRHSDAMTQRLRQQCPTWIEAWPLSDAQLAQRIRQDQIDILVDLAGHTIGNRLPMLAGRVAPVQVAYLGYPNTTGVPAIDYRITDAIADPPGTTDAWHSEKLWRLPRTFLCYRPPEFAPPVLPRHADDLICFGSFNTITKINQPLLAAWARALSAVPNSRLLLKSTGMTSPSTRSRILAALTAVNIAPERLELLEATKTMQDHLALYNRMDIALDTWPYNGTTTTCEALWMGVPVVTLAGQMHRARVGMSLLTSVGLSELIAPDENAFPSLVATLANDRPRLAALRTSLRDRMRASPLMDEPGFTRDVEAAYRAMWRQWCNR
jgi:predicted O-linked N-acetylglucosamine transferase (SPINDLY family)